jgi:hypothetical protein
MRPDCTPRKLVLGLLAVIVVAVLHTGADAAEPDRTPGVTAAPALTGYFTPRYTLLYGLIDTSLLDFPAIEAGAAGSGGVTFRFDAFAPGWLGSDSAMPGLGAPWFALPGRGDLGAERGRGVAGSVLLRADPIGYVTFAGAASTVEDPGSGATFLDGVGGYDPGTFSAGLDAPSSVMLSLGGGDLPLMEGFAYRFTGMQRDSGERPGLGETAYALAGEYSFTLGNMAVAPSIEFVHLDSLALDEGDGDSQDFLTKSLRMMWRNWNLSVSHTGRTTFAQGAPPDDDYVVSLEAGYGFEFGLSVDAGWRALEEDGVLEDDFGVRFTYGMDF